MNIKYLLIGCGLILTGLILVRREKSAFDFVFWGGYIFEIILLLVGILFIGSGFGWW